MGQALADQFPVCRAAFEEADRGARRVAEHADLRRPRRDADPHREHPAGDSHRERRRLAPARRARAAARVRRRPQPRRVLGARGGRHAGVRRRRAPGPATAGATCRRPCRSAQGAMAAILGLDEAGVAQACLEAAQGEVVSPANLNAPGQIVIAGSSRRGGARRRARQGARRQARHPAAGERAVPLRADEAGRGSAGARTAGASRRTTRASRSSPTSTPSRSATAAARIEALIAQVSAPVRWEDCRPAACVRGRHHVC